MVYSAFGDCCSMCGLGGSRRCYSYIVIAAEDPMVAMNAIVFVFAIEGLDGNIIDVIDVMEIIGIVGDIEIC